MHIPEKYRDRYDRLALNHPWMREMRDEEPLISNLNIDGRAYLVIPSDFVTESTTEISVKGRRFVLADDSTNGIDGGTNGIADGPPLVDGLPDGDAVEILRKWANFWGASHSTHTQCDSNWEKTTMRTLADMVERDYVKLSEYERAIRDAQELYLQVERERDEWKTKCETREFAYKQADAERKRYSEQIDELRAARDDAHEQWEHWSKLATDIIALFYPVEEEGLPNDAYSVVKDSASKLAAERDDLKRKLEILKAHGVEIVDAVAGGFEVYNEAIRERDEWKAKYLGALNDVEYYKSLWMHSHEGLGRSAKRAEVLERVKKLRGSNCGGCDLLNAMLGEMNNDGTWRIDSDIDKLIYLLTDDDANNDLPPYSDVSAKDVDANDANETLDSREKLEADVAKWSVSRAYGSEGYDFIIGALDRQAAITKSELCKQCEWPSLAAQPDQEAYDRIAELEAERDYWKRQVELCMQSAYPPSHSPERSYDPDVMGYPDRHGCTTPSTLVSAVIDWLRDERAAQYMAIVKECAGLEAENEKLKAEIIQYGKDCGECGTAMPKGISWPRFDDGSLLRYGDLFIDGAGNPHECHGVEFIDPNRAGLGASTIIHGNRYGIGGEYDGVAYNLYKGKALERPTEDEGMA